MRAAILASYVAL